MAGIDMHKYAVVFAGQGAQKPGMGKSLYEASPAARAIFDKAGEEIKFDCFEADAERLRQTEVTQPAVYTMDIAAYAALLEALEADDNGLGGPSGLAGFSVGEYAAYTAAGLIGNLEDGLAIVKARSLLMKAAGTASDGSQKGAMAAGMGDRESVLALVEKARDDGVLEAVNFNSPQQTVVAGDTAAVERFTALAKGDRALGVKAIPLAVSGAFHSPLMGPAADTFAEVLSDYSFGEPSIPIYLNVTGGKYEEYSNAAVGTTSAKARALMVCQIQSPVQWQYTIEAMADDGIETIIEVGPGRTLTGLTKKIAPEIAAMNVEDARSLAETVTFFKER